MIKITPDNMGDCSVILNDDEMYSSIEGCRIALFTPEQGEKLDAGTDPHRLGTPHVSVDVRHLLAWALAHGYHSEDEQNELHNILMWTKARIEERQKNANNPMDAETYDALRSVYATYLGEKDAARYFGG